VTLDEAYIERRGRSWGWVTSGGQSLEASRERGARLGHLTTPSYNRMVVYMDNAFDADRAFAALADATRRDIVLRALTGAEGVAELAGHYPMSFAAVQKHIAVLERAGLVTKQRTGRRKVVQTNMLSLRRARGLLDEYEALWRGRIDRMTGIINEGALVE